jgi:RNA polymerase sigma-70 factor (ECF subfamily)
VIYLKQTKKRHTEIVVLPLLKKNIGMTRLIAQPETSAIRQIQLGNLRVFENMFREYYQMLCNYALKFGGDPDTAEELVQDLFYTLWEKRMELNITTSVKSYLFSAVHNRCLKFIEHRSVEQKYRSYYLKHESEIDNGDMDSASVADMQQIINRVLDSLPERCGKIFRLNRFEGLKYQEIAEKLSISVKTVEANMGRALRVLRKSLKDFYEVA